jgi:NTP pyrophosphatase (non-canonical NTP hydrolase)
MPTSHKPWHKSWLLKVASVVLVLGVLFFALPTATNAKNIPEVLTWWSDSLIQFFRPGQKPNIEEFEYKTDHPGLQKIYDAITEAGITEQIVPSSLSDEFKLSELKITQLQGDISVHTRLRSDSNEILFTAIAHSEQAMLQHEKMQEILQKTAYNANDLVTIVEMLRAPGGCPWDREQTHQSIRNDFIEETYEVIEAIDKADPALLREELGDVLLQVAMHAQMEREAGRCTFDDIANDICKKMIHRHPHVFGDVQADTSDQVLSNWEVIKSEEKNRETLTDKLNAIPRQFPALMRAAKVGKKLYNK